MITTRRTLGVTQIYAAILNLDLAHFHSGIFQTTNYIFAGIFLILGILNLVGGKND